MKIDEIEFRNKKGQEIEPTKSQLVIYIKSLHKEIKELEKALELAVDFIEDVTGSCPYDSELIQMQDKCIECTDDIKNCWNEYFKTKAKEMMKSE